MNTKYNAVKISSLGSLNFVAAFFVATHIFLLLGRTLKIFSVSSDLFQFVKILSASGWSCLFILILGWYHSSIFFLNNDQNQRVPYWWAISLGLSLPLPISSQISWSGPLLAMVLTGMGHLILSGYDQLLSARRFFSIGVLAGLPSLGRLSPLLVLPVVFIQLFIVYPFSFNSLVIVLLGYVVTELWIWVVNGFWGLPVGLMEFRLGGGEWWLPRGISNFWLGIVLVCATGGFLLLLNRRLKLKVFHRRVVSCLFTLLAFAPWYITCSISVADVIWSLIPFLAMPVWAFFRFLHIKVSLAMFFLVNIVLIISNITSM